MERREEELIRQYLNEDSELKTVYEEHLTLKNKLTEFYFGLIEAPTAVFDFLRP